MMSSGVVKCLHVIEQDNPAYYILGALYIVGDGRGYLDVFEYICSLEMPHCLGWVVTVFEKEAVDEDIAVYVGCNSLSSAAVEEMQNRFSGGGLFGTGVRYVLYWGVRR